MAPRPEETIVHHYHRRTSHRFEAYAPGPDTLDWDAQPAGFRHFDGAPQLELPPFENAVSHPDLMAALTRPFSTLSEPAPALAPTLASLGALLQLALGITAWKSYGPDRWAVRANPSSGNLHPTEAYMLISGLAGIPDGLYHYRVENHMLERRADFVPLKGSPFLHIALTSVMWREAWKYGERAFRYCQLDIGHAVAALRYAAAVLGWKLTEQPHIPHASLAHVLGLDRLSDFPARRQAETEREEAEILLNVVFDDGQNGQAKLPEIGKWHGIASTIDAHPVYRWPILDEIAQATRSTRDSRMPHHQLPPAASCHLRGTSPTAANTILSRRSAQRFDAGHVMPRVDFMQILESLQPSAGAPWDALAHAPHINLLLFVHRVEGLESGLYLLPRVSRLLQTLQSELDARFLRQPVDDGALQLLAAVPAAELHRLTRSLHCHQDIAANACFAVVMLAEFDAVIKADPAAYRNLFREAGLIGQALYLQAEAHGLRGTGIGCYFDDPVHELLGLKGDTFKSMYHFTVGLPLEDSRIQTITTWDALK